MTRYAGRAANAEYTLLKIHDETVKEVHRIIARSRVVDAAITVLARHNLLSELSVELNQDMEPAAP